jgi:hypothetical protein
VLQKADLFHGIARQYQPVDEDGEDFPPRGKTRRSPPRRSFARRARFSPTSSTRLPRRSMATAPPGRM